VDHSRVTAIVELDPSGHRLQYVRLLLERLPVAQRVLLVSRRVADAPEFAGYLARTETEVVVLQAGGDNDHDAAVTEALATAIERGVGHLVVPDGDKAIRPLLAALVLGSLTWSRPRRPRVTVLLMRTALPGGSEPATLGMALKPPLVAVLRRLPGVRVLFLTDAFGVVTRRRGFPGVRPVRDPVSRPAPPDPAPPGEAPRMTDGHARVGILGVISARKNVPVLVRAAAGRPQVDVVLAGRFAPGVRDFLATDPDAARLRAEGRLAVDDRLLDDGEFDAALRSVDVAAVLHDNDAPSGIVAEACARGVPVLGPDRGWIATVLAATGCGLPASVNDPDAVAASLERLLTDRARYACAARSAGCSLGVDDFVERLLGDPA
jgi:glycosyltransferase involved in cell wall biosynthesis